MEDTPKRLESKLRLSNPWTQNFISGMCLFLAVGIYLAITGLGAGAGKQSAAQVAMTTNAVLYGIFTISGFFGGSVMNTIGPKLTFMIGIFGYPFYASGLWYYDATGHEWYPIFSGAVLGLSAGLLWTVAGFIQFCYGEERKKGHYIAIQTILLAVGSSVGSAIPLGVNAQNRTADGVPTAVYATFVSIMASALFLAGFCIVNPRRVVREDGTRLAHFHVTSFREEFVWCLRLLKDWRIVALLLPMFATEIMLAIIPTLNAFSCNLRTRSFNNFLFQVIQIPTAYLFGLVLDKLPLARPKRGLVALGISFSVTLVGWILALVVQTKYNLTRYGVSPQWDWLSGGGYPMFLTVVLLFGMIYVLNQMVVMWTLSALTNDPYVLARYAGLYKGMLSCGLCVTFGIEAAKVSYLAHTIVQTVAMLGACPIMFFIIAKCVKDTKYFDEVDVVPPKEVQIIKGEVENYEGTIHEVEQGQVSPVK